MDFMVTFFRRYRTPLFIAGVIALYFAINTIVSNALGVEVEWFPNLYSIEVTGLQVCDGERLNSHPTQQISQTQFEANQVYICGHLVNLSAPKSAGPRIYIMPEVGGAIWHKREIFRFEEDDFFIPLKNLTPEVGSYTINIHRGKEILYRAMFEVVP